MIFGGSSLDGSFLFGKALFQKAAARADNTQTRAILGHMAQEQAKKGGMAELLWMPLQG